MTLQINIQIIGDKRLIAKFLQLKDFMKSDQLRIVLEEAKNRLVYLAARLAPKGETQQLAQIYGQVENFGTTNVQIRVRSMARYAVHVEFPTKPHVIRPREKKVLFWYQYSTPKTRLTANGKEIGGVFSFAQEVHHPGTKEQPFLRPALAQVQPRLQQAIQRVIRERIKAS